MCLRGKRGKHRRRRMALQRPLPDGAAGRRRGVQHPREHDVHLRDDHVPLRARPVLLQLTTSLTPGLLACAPLHAPAPSASLATTAGQTTASHDLAGPDCSSPGPTVDATPLGFGTGGRKPPLGRQRYDLRVRNPSGYPLWLVLEGYGDFPAIVATVSVERNRTEPSVFVWSLEGFTPAGEASRLRAVYVAPDTDVLLRDVVVQAFGPPATLPVRFVDTMTIGRRWAQEWLGHDAKLPPRGEVALTDRWESVIRREPEARERVDAEVHVLCVQRIGTGGPR